MASTISAGTTAGTAIVVSGDTSGSLVLQTNGTTTAVTIDTSQNVGIGTSSPATKLHLLTPSATAVALRAGNSVSYAEFQVDASGNSQLIAPGGVQIFNTNGAERMRIDSSGNVGIGVTPATRLDVGGTGLDRLLINPQAAGSGVSLTAVNAANNAYSPYTTNGTVSIFQTGGTEQMRIDSAGLLKFNSGYGSAATAYGCRAWVNFNGTGTVAIRASGNVSSITDNGTGDYTVNFTTALVDANYSAGWTAKYLLNTTRYGCSFQIASQATASVRVLLGDFTAGTPAAHDFELINVQVFR